MGRSELQNIASRANLEKARAVQQSRNQIIPCLFCQALFTVRPSEVRKKYCSWACRRCGMRGQNAPNAQGGAWMRGKGNPNWKGGSGSSHKSRNTTLIEKQRRWRQSVFERDMFICQRCGFDKGKALQAHHIALWSKFPERRFDIENGITLCQPCHRWVHSKNNAAREWLIT